MPETFKETWRIPITPVPASRPRVPRFGKPFYVGAYSAFRDEMSALIERCDLPPPLNIPMVVAVTFVCAKPKNPANPYPKGDIDNYVKAVLDSINGKAFMKDDRIITTLWAHKRYTVGDERPHIHISFNPESQ